MIFTRVAIDAQKFKTCRYTQDLSELRMMRFKIGQHRIILYHINPEYALLYQDSGDNSLNLKSPPTNVKNGLGIFTAISSDTLYLDVTQ